MTKIELQFLIDRYNLREMLENEITQKRVGVWGYMDADNIPDENAALPVVVRACYGVPVPVGKEGMVQVEFYPPENWLFGPDALSACG